MKFYPESEKVDELKWCSLKRSFSFATKFIYLIGGRGWGKTYSVKTHLFTRFVKCGEKFAWCRTTEIALENIKTAEQFFGRMENLKEIGIKSYDIKKNIIYINGKVAGYLFAVSTFHNVKGSDFDVNTIVWDEFMRAKGERPLPARRQKFLDLVESVGRHNASRAILMSNSTNQFDEMLSPFKVKLEKVGCYLFREQSAVIHYMKPSVLYRENKLNTLAALGMDESQQKFAYGNEFTDYGDYGKIDKLSYISTFKFDDDGYLSLFTDPEGAFYIRAGLVKNSRIFALKPEFVGGGVRLINQRVKKDLAAQYGDGKILFCDGYCRAAFQEYFL